MEDKSFYLSELALEMLVSSQGVSKIPLPTSGGLKEASREDMLKELYSLVSNGIMENNEEKNCFTVNEELVPFIKTILSSKSVLRVTDMRYTKSPFYCYLSADNVTVMEKSGFHGGVKLGSIKAESLSEKLFNKFNITENSENVSGGTEELETGDDIFPAEMLLMDIEELKSGFDDTEGCIDVIRCENLNIVCRIMIFKKSSEYKIAVMNERKILICDYTFANFCKATERMTGED